MSTYNVVAASNESTVVTEYEPQSKRSDAYQSEAALEQAFIKMLEEQGYAYLPIHDNADLVANLRRQLELLNNYTFTDKEWDFFFKDKIANANDGIKEKTRRIQEDNIQNLTREDGSTVNITLLDKKNIHNNRLQVINQYVENGGNYDNRYDVTILVNGLPLVHVELKRRGVPIKEAFNQINRYQRDSFWAGSGLYEYVQIFVISNGTNTKYYSNTTRDSHIKESAGTTRKSSKKTSNSFEFTSFWADGKNRVIPDLVDFTRTFFARHTLLNILTKYCVFTSEDLLLVMRPYQIAATERILSRIEVSTNYKQTGTLAAGGYIWHTTGSGKTLTSFKTAQLASNLPYIDKVLFVVDRKDLDYQTMKEYDRFEKGAANGNTSTQVLQRQLEDRDAKGNPHTYKIIITTIQKLALFVSRNKGHEIFQKHVVLIFDECHRSQFGDMHEDITKYFEESTYADASGGISPEREELYRICEQEGVGITVMKGYAGGRLFRAETSPFGTALTPVQCLHYALTRPAVASVMAGFDTPAHVDAAAAYETATEEEKDYASVLANAPHHAYSGQCTYCGHCAPCPSRIDIAMVNKLYDLAVMQDEIPATVKAHYGQLSAAAGDCVRCGGCETRCPFGVRIIDRMEKAAALFGQD